MLVLLLLLVLLLVLLLLVLLVVFAGVLMPGLDTHTNAIQGLAQPMSSGPRALAVARCHPKLNNTRAGLTHSAIFSFLEFELGVTGTHWQHTKTHDSNIDTASGIGNLNADGYNSLSDPDQRMS